jgi:hypothetical protein
MEPEANSQELEAAFKRLATCRQFFSPGEPGERKSETWLEKKEFASG